jgi:hypothetical protein
MSLITKKYVTEREAASYKLDRSTVELVKFYSEFIGSPQEHVVNQALLYVFSKDREFNAWLKANNKPAILPKAKLAKSNDGTLTGAQQGGHVAALGNGKRA